MEETELDATISASADERKRLFDLTAQSWEMELAISGVAMFALLQLPDLLDQGYDYLDYEFMSRTMEISGLLMSLAYSMIKSTSYILFIAFMVNFIMRAFWVGLVGLLAVYPQGVQYHKIPFVSKYAQGRMAEDLGPLDRYIVRLDRNCNIVFALAFLFVFMIFLIATAYLVILAVYLVLRPALPHSIWQLVKYIGYSMLTLYLVATLVLSNKKIREHPTGTRLHYRLMKFTQKLFLGMHKPISFISNTFYSNVSTKRLLATAVLMYGVFMALFMMEFSIDLGRVDRRSQGFFPRHLYTARIDEHYVNPGVYDNLRDEDSYIAVASIQSDVIQEPFIRLFIAYPKSMDTLLTKIAKEPVMDKTLPRKESRRRYATWSSSVLTSLLHISVNDSVYVRPDVLFTQRGLKNQRGWQTVLIPANMRVGKNLLKIGLKSENRDEPDALVAIPFWYAPN